MRGSEASLAYTRPSQTCRGLTAANRKAITQLVNSIFVPFSGASLEIDFDNPNTVFEVLRLVCSCSEPELLFCRERCDENQLCGLGANAMIAAMCGVSFPLLDGDADFDEPQARCLFCDFEVLPANPEALPDDMSVLMARHSEACAYRSVFSLISKRGKRNDKLTEPNKALLAFLKREVVRGRVGRGHSMDAICTSLALRYLGFKRTGTHFGVYSKNGEDMAEVLSQMTIPAVAGLYNFIHSFHGDGDGSCQVWPPKRERARRPKWSPGFRQVTVLPKLNEE